MHCKCAVMSDEALDPPLGEAQEYKTYELQFTSHSQSYVCVDVFASEKKSKISLLQINRKKTKRQSTIFFRFAKFCISQLSITNALLYQANTFVRLLMHLFCPRVP